MKKKLSILVSNDDGIDSDGIYSLVNSLKKIADVFVVAPETQQSAVGHAITMHRPLRVKEFRKEGKFFGYAVDGTPADCVKLGIRHLIKHKPDLIVSGINHGSNTAISVIYSGTVSAATEGTILGIPSIAISLTSYEPKVDFFVAAQFAQKIAIIVAEKGLPKGTLLNINVPPVAKKQLKGIEITRQGKSSWNDEFEARKDPGNKNYFWLKGDLIEIDEEDDIDQKAIMNNKISITPIHYDLTDYDAIERIRDWNIKF